MKRRYASRMGSETGVSHRLITSLSVLLRSVATCVTQYSAVCVCVWDT